jgi:general secretion pathway protein H
MKMPIFGTDLAHNKGAAGFTLVELLAVLTILAVAVTAFSFNSGRNLDTAKFRALMIKTTAEISADRSAAISSMAEKVFRIDLKRRRLGDVELPPGVDLTATVAESERYENGTVGIRFYPAGTSSGGTLAFTFHNKVYEIRVNWLTGNVSLHPA